MDPNNRLSQDEFIVLITQHERRVRGFASTLVYHREDIDEVVQQTFLSAWKKIDEFKRVNETLERDFVRWICTIAKFQSLGYVRKHRGSRMLFDSELVSKLADLQLQDDVHQENRRLALSDCIEKLAPKQKDLVLRYYRSTESAAEIAKQDGVTPQAIFKKLRHIRETLLTCIGRSLRASEAGS
jgi:RNA polymerase sigma-70 factor (ECF subfamily)